MSQSKPEDPAEDLPPTVDLPSAVEWSKPKLSRLWPFRLMRKVYLRLLALFSRRYRAIVWMDSIDERLAKFDSEIAESEERRKKNLHEINNELNKLAADVAMLNLQTANLNLGLSVSLAASAIEKLERLDKIQLCLARVSPIMDKHDWWIVNGLPISFYEHVLDTQDSITTDEGHEGHH